MGKQNGVKEEKKIWSINGRFLTQRMTGVQRYAYEIVRSISEILLENDDIASRLDIQLLMPRGAVLRSDMSRIATRHTTFGSGIIWDQLVLPFYQGAGLLSLGNLGPITARSHIVCVHDANTFTAPDSYSSAFGLFYRTFLPSMGRTAHRVSTVSKFSAEMLVKYGVCERKKIFIASNGHEHVLRWDAGRSNLPFLRNQKRPFVMLLGSKAKHKNVNVVLQQAEAFDAANIDLVVVGAGAGIFSHDQKDLRGRNVHQIGFVNDDELAALYDRAACLAFPSRTEGFGIPPLEAMARGCPVISSTAPSLIEVGGDAVVYTNPDDSDDWRKSIIELVQNEERRLSLIKKGRLRAKLFSWKRSAQIYLDEMLQLSSRP